jgi:hypothetical protein
MIPSPITFACLCESAIVLPTPHPSSSPNSQESEKDSLRRETNLCRDILRKNPWERKYRDE